MTTPKRYHYAPALLGAACLLAMAVVIYPYDYSISDTIRSFSRSVGKTHIIQELLNLFRPFGKGDVVLFIVAGLGLCGSRKRSLHIILALIIMTALIWPLKIGIGRERPGYKNSHSFPSGDAATAAAFFTPLAAATPWMIPVAVAVNTGVAVGRVYDGRHYPSDVLAGMAFGIIATSLAGGVLRRWSWRPRRRWFAIMGGGLLLFAVINLSWARGTPFVLDFLRVWGPLGAIAILARFVPVWLHQRQKSPHPYRPFLFVSLMILTLYLLLTTASTLWDRDEPRFARATVEMVESGNYLYPTFNDHLRADKPILIYWLMSIPVRILGVSELSCRMVAPFATLLAALLTFWIAGRLFDRTTSLWAGLILMLTPLMTVSGTAATTDALLLACITGSLAAFMLSWLNGFRLWHLIPMIIALAAALLTKGPVGLAVPVLVISAILIFAKSDVLRPWRYAGWLVFSIIAAIVLFLSWGLQANAATQGEFLRLGIGKHVVSRSLNAMESHGGKSILFYFYYLPVVLLTFFPWIIYLPRLLIYRQEETGMARQNIRLLVCWIAPVIILMSLVATKLPHYILPCWPALAMATALGLQNAVQGHKDGNKAFAARFGFGSFLIIGFVLGFGLMLSPWVLAKFPIFGLRVPATVLGTVFVAMTGLAWRYYRKGLHYSVAGILVSGMLVVLLSASLLLLPAIEPLKLSPQIAKIIQENSPPSIPVFTCGYGEPSLNFYLGRCPIDSLEETELATWTRAPGQGILIVTATKLNHQQRALKTAGIEQLGTVPGFNYSHGKQVLIHILLRNNTP